VVGSYLVDFSASKPALGSSSQSLWGPTVAPDSKARQGRAEQSKYRIWDEGARNVSTTGLVKRFRTFDGG
jgi:hypothetical protein